MCSKDSPLCRASTACTSSAARRAQRWRTLLIRRDDYIMDGVVAHHRHRRSVHLPPQHGNEPTSDHYTVSGSRQQSVVPPVQASIRCATLCVYVQCIITKFKAFLEHGWRAETQSGMTARIHNPLTLNLILNPERLDAGDRLVASGARIVDVDDGQITFGYC